MKSGGRYLPAKTEGEEEEKSDHAGILVTTQFSFVSTLDVWVFSLH